MIKISNLSKSFGSKEVLNGINFKVESKQSYVIMGGSGSGKSVLIKCIFGLMDPDKGSKVYIDNDEQTSLSRHERLRSMGRFGVLFQGGALFDSLTVWQNIAFAALNSKTLTTEQAYKLAVKKLYSVGLGEEVAQLFPSELSGGMQKRVALARAIALDPKIIFFDEPTAGLDPIMSGLISELIKKCSRELGATTITITHDMNCAKIIADNAALLYKGEFIWSGEGHEIHSSKNPYLKQFVSGSTKGPFEVLPNS